MTAVSEAEKGKFFEQVDQASRKAVWCALATVERGAPRVQLVRLYDLSAFWPGGPTDPNYVAVRIAPERVELSKMFGSKEKRVWRR